MAKVTLDIEDPKVLEELGTEWRFGSGWDPGKPNEGLVSQTSESPARLADYDDSDWEVIDDMEAGGMGRPSGRAHHPGIRKQRSIGFTFGWYRIRIPLPERVGDFEVAGSEVWFETDIDDYGELWVDGEWDRDAGAINGFNVTNRVKVTDSAAPGTDARGGVSGGQRASGSSRWGHIHALRSPGLHTLDGSHGFQHAQAAPVSAEHRPVPGRVAAAPDIRGAVQADAARVHGVGQQVRGVTHQGGD